MRTTRSRLGLLVLLSWAAAVPAGATTYVLAPDAALLDQATHVAELGFLRAVPAVAGDAAATEYTAIVSRPIKGSFPSSVARVRLPGGRDASGAFLRIRGLPAPRPGDDAIVFLEENADGSFGVLHWALGFFGRVDLGGEGAIARRDFRDADFVAGTARPGDLPARDYEAFSRWLRDRATGSARAPDYFRTRPRALSPRFNLFRVSGRNLRWLEFDAGGTVDYRIRSAGSFGSTGQFTPAMQAWVREPRTPVRLRVVGGTNSTGGLSRSDRTNSLIFGDPNNIMPGRYNCSAGGVVATGGVWFVRQRSTFRGRNFFRILEGDIVLNDGVECLLRGQAARSAEVFTHELGHTLGIAHSCGDAESGPCNNPRESEATMRATGQFDGRGASIRSDDEAALRALYEGPGGDDPSGPPPPTDDPGSPQANLQPPTDLSGNAVSGKKIKLTWEDRSSGEGAYEVWIKRRRSAWTLVQTLPANSAAATIKELDKGTKYKFKVRSRAGTRVSGFSEVLQLQTLGRAEPDDPSDLEALEVSSTEVVLGWKDNSDNEKAFSIWQKVGDEEWRARTSVGANRTEATLGVSPSTEYRFRVRARNGRKVSGFTNVVTVTTPPA